MYITSITPPDEVQKAIDDQSRLNTIKDMDKFMRMKAAMAMEKAADSQAEAGAGIGMGMGVMLPAMFGSMQLRPQNSGDKIAPTTICPDCSREIPADARFCPVCGHQQVVLGRCQSCGKNLSPSARFCPRCGQPVETRPSCIVCPHCNAENLPHSTFCNQCGERLSAGG